jgi:hypothetical protein
MNRRSFLRTAALAAVTPAIPKPRYAESLGFTEADFGEGIP